MFAVKKMYNVVLKRVVGKYLRDELDVDQLDISLLDGSIKLNTLELNVDEINVILANAQGQNSGVRLRKCFIDHLEISIPSVQALLTEGCDVTVAGVQASVYLLDEKNT